MMQYYEYLSELIPFTAVLAVLCTIYRRKNIRVSTKHIALAFVFAVYIVGVFYFTEAGTLYDALQCTFSSRALNLLPFSKRIDTTAYLLNIVMFIPLGIMVPFIMEESGQIQAHIIIRICIFPSDRAESAAQPQKHRHRRCDSEHLRRGYRLPDLQDAR